MWAVSCNRTRIVELLVDAGADVEVEDNVSVAAGLDCGDPPELAIARGLCRRALAECRPALERLWHLAHGWSGPHSRHVQAAAYSQPLWCRLVTQCQSLAPLANARDPIEACCSKRRVVGTQRADAGVPP